MKKPLILLTLLLPMLIHAQKMTVESMRLDPGDATANLTENLRTDNNGDYAGLVRVYLAASGASFSGPSFLEQKICDASEYWVFMAKGAYKLHVAHPNYLPLDINFRDWGIEGIESRRTYVLTITVPQVGAVQEDDGMRYLAMTVEPRNSMVLVDGVSREVKNGEVKVLLPKGSHRYQVSATGYATKEGTVEVGDQTKPLEIKLASALSTLRVECATPGALIYVNDEQKGTTPWSGSLTTGNYKVEARLDGYRSSSQNIILGENENRTLSIPALRAVAGSLNIDYSPIGSEVYIDGKNIGLTPGIFRDIPVGNRNVEIRKEGYETLKKTVAVKENEQASLTGSLTALANSSSSGNASTSSSSTLSGKETFTVNGVSFTMVRVEGGTFTMGATNEQGSVANNNEKPTHKVTLSTFSIGETEVTQALWQAVMGSNPSYFKDNPQNPVEKVSWDDCQEFIKKLNNLTGKTFRLPTEAEWEFAARGGNKSKHYKYSGSNTIDDVAWYDNNAYNVGQDGKRDVSNPNYGTHRVKSKFPNELALYDMSGNVWEWCEDWYGSYGSSSQTNPKGATSGSARVLRGGSWYSRAGYCRVSYRFSSSPDNRDSNLGLRLAL